MFDLITNVIKKPRGSNYPGGFKALLRKPLHLLAFGFGSGLSPFAPGTVGSGLSLLLYLFMSPLPLWVFAVLTLLAAVAGITICNATARDLGEKDPGGIVWDEIAGMWLALLPLHYLLRQGEISLVHDWYLLPVAFFVFRGLDISKLWPVSWGEQQKGGVGIMLDDLIAGIMTGVFIYSMAFVAMDINQWI